MKVCTGLSTAFADASSLKAGLGLTPRYIEYYT